VTTTRIGTSQKYAKGWEQAFGKTTTASTKKAAAKKTAATKKSSPKKKAATKTKAKK
jgi:hypothetical protein